TIQSALERLRSGELEESHRQQAETLIRNRAALYQNAYAALIGDTAWINELTPENIRELLGGSSWSPEDIETIIRKGDAEAVEKLLLSGERFPTQRYRAEIGVKPGDTRGDNVLP
ncbi:MAG: hypothetical protein LBG87_06560, partial [Spirochaetaceae bacterium]|nr:hypothetical protein [Spirochaetaceae bacterium]